MPTPAEQNHRPWAKRLALVLVSLAVTVLLLEGLATLYAGERFVRGAQMGNSWKIAGRFDPDFGWSGRPHAHGRIVDGTMDYTVQLNSAGFRDPERALAKPPGVRRVLALGDSVTWGWGVQRGERFTDLLEQRLGPNVEVINLSCPGYGTDQQYWTLLERGLAYEPDAVLLCMIINDIPEAERASTYKMRKPLYVRAETGAWRIEGRPVPLQDGPSQGPGAWQRLTTRSALLALATRQLLEPSTSNGGQESNYSRPTPEMLEGVHEAADKLTDAGSVTHHLLTLLRDACAERDLPLLLTHVPHKHDQFLYEPRFPAPEELGPAPFRSYFARRLEEVCVQLGLPFAPVDDAFLDACRSGTRLHVGDGHPNADGHRLVADRVEPALRALLDL